MTVLLAPYPREWPYAAPPDRLETCWHCDEPTAGAPLVLWVGQGELLVLHGDCAERLGTHLIGDARELRLATGGPTWARRAARLAGYGLRLAEQCEEVS